MAFSLRPFVVLALLGATTAQAQDSGSTPTTDESAAVAVEQAPAAITNGQRFGAWTVNCVAVAVGQTSCTLTQRVLRSSDGAFVADLIGVRDPEGKTFIVSRVPIGASLPAGFVMREAESEDLMTFTWQVCSPQVCEALVELDADKVAAYSAEGNQMVAAFRPTPQSEPFVFQLSLSGLSDGLDALAE